MILTKGNSVSSWQMPQPFKSLSLIIYCKQYLCFYIVLFNYSLAMTMSHKLFDKCSEFRTLSILY